MPHFDMFDLVRWLHFICLVAAGGAAVVALLLSGLEDEREDLRGLSAALWKKLVVWGLRGAVVAGGVLLAIKLARGGHPFDAYYLHVKLLLVAFLLVLSELAPKRLAVSRRGAALTALLLFLLATFVAVNGNAFGRKMRPPGEVSAGPAV